MSLRGTYYCKLTGRWVARIGRGYKAEYLGRFATEEEAHEAYKRAAATVPPSPREAARATGLTRYSTGKPCPQGHVCERMVSSGICCECLKESKARGKDRLLEAQRRHRRENPEKWRNWKRKGYEKTRRNPVAVLSTRMATLMRHGLKSGKAGRSWRELVPYSPEELRTHLERQFLPSMGWHNMGKWHVDHILPVSSFSFETPEDEDFKACWALTNLRPLWALDNIKKKNKRVTLL